MRRPLIIALIGLILISFFEWGINNEVGHYSTNQQTYQNQSAFFGGPVLLGFRDEIAWLWHWLRDNHDELLVIFTALLFGVTALLVRYTRGLMVYTRRLWTSTNNLVTESNDAAKKELRAYVGITEGHISLVEAGKCLRADLKIVNSGQTPANDVRLALDATIRDYAPTGDVPILPIFRKGRAYMMPRSKWDIHTNILQIDNVLLDAIDGGKKEVLIWGCIEYTDIYSRGQNSFFCYRRGWRIGDRPPYIWDIEPNHDGNKAT